MTRFTRGRRQRQRNSNKKQQITLAHAGFSHFESATDQAYQNLFSFYASKQFTTLS
jgi:hypothetical protein